VFLRVKWVYLISKNRQKETKKFLLTVRQIADRIFCAKPGSAASGEAHSVRTAATYPPGLLWGCLAPLHAYGRLHSTRQTHGTGNTP
jgi:hypothetical protein